MEPTWTNRADRSTYLLGDWQQSWTREPRANSSYCDQRFELGWRFGPTKTCPRCAEIPVANICPPPGTLSDFVQSFAHAFVLCHAHSCARHLSGYWPLDVQLEIFDALKYNRGLARTVGPAVAHALGLTAPGRRALKSHSRTADAAAAHRVLVLLAHLEIVHIAARRGLANVIIIEADIRPVHRHALSLADITHLRAALDRAPWELVRPTGFFSDYAQWVADKEKKPCPQPCLCVPWPVVQPTERQEAVDSPGRGRHGLVGSDADATPARPRFCEVRAPPSLIPSDDQTEEPSNAIRPNYAMRCNVKNTEAFAVHSRAFPRFGAMRRAVRRGLMRVAANISARGIGVRLSVQRR